MSSLSFDPERDRKLDDVRLSVSQRCALGAPRAPCPLYLSIPHFLSPRGIAQWECSSIRGCLLMKEGKEERDGERERGIERLFWCAFPRDAAPDRKSGSHALCRSVFVAFRRTHGLSLRPTGLSLPPVPASGPRRRDDVFLLVEHASWLSDPSLSYDSSYFFSPPSHTLLFTLFWSLIVFIYS